LNNLTYEDIESVVEDLARIKRKKYARRFIDADDIAQEVRIKCWKSIHVYDPERGQSIRTFLNVCTENHLRNLMRDNFVTFNPPNKKDPEYFDQSGKPTEKALKDIRIQKYLKRYKRKRAVKMPASVDRVFANTAEGMPCTHDHAGHVNLDVSIRQILFDRHPKVIQYYDILITGGAIPKSIKIQIQEVVEEILQENNDGQKRSS